MQIPISNFGEFNKNDTKNTAYASIDDVFSIKILHI